MLGANGAALGLLAAWFVDDRRAARRGDDRENDLLGVYVFAAVLLLLPLAVTEASVVAGVVGWPRARCWACCCPCSPAADRIDLVPDPAHRSPTRSSTAPSRR